MKRFFCGLFFVFFPKKRRLKEDEKKEIRLSMHALKKMIPEEDKQSNSNAVFSAIEKMDVFKKAQTILFYWSISSELPTHDYLNKWKNSGKKVFLPAIKGNELHVKQFIDKGSLGEGSLGISEPQSENYTGKMDLIIVPGVAFDQQKNRMGRGKGYYDRFLKSQKGTIIGVGYDCQLLEEIPTYWGDVKMDVIITPSTTIN